MTVVCGFELLRELHIAELNTSAGLYRHVGTGAELLALSNDDENKTFGVAFRTLPPDNSGVPHILEHSVLGGSRRYPVKEPFIELVKGSLATFINAFTRADSTVYPVASQNLQDLSNLMDVYLDAVFGPLLTRQTFDQEGWHYELDNADAPLAYRGIVFNEMKGTLAEPVALQRVEGLRALFPDSDYAWYSGGQPQAIPDLTYEQFRSFYATYYHPSNARFFLYGDLPIGDALCRIDEHLAGFAAAPATAEVRLQPRFDAPRSVTVRYAAGAAARPKDYATLSWVTIPAGDPTEMLAADVLEYALIGSPASPLRKALIEAELGEDLTAVMAGPLRQRVFSVGLKGVEPKNAGQVEPLILDTLAALARDGLEPAMIDAAVNTIEFALRENGAAGGQRGINLAMRALESWLYGGDPFAMLTFEAPLAEVKARLAGGPAYLQDMIRQHLLDNPHRVTLILEPDLALGQRQEAQERARLDQARAAMSEAEAQAVLENTRALKERQQAADSPAALATLPMLRRSDLESQIKTIPLEERTEAGTKTLVHALATNGIIYLDLGFDLRAVPASALPFVTILGRALLEMGTRSEDYVRLAQRIGRLTGGIWPSVFISEARTGEPSPAWFFLRGKATASRGPELLEILRDILTGARLDDRTRLRQIVLAEKARRETGLLTRGSELVAGRLGAHFSQAGWAREQVGGLGGLFAVRQLAEDMERDWPAVVARLEAVRQALVTRRTMLANVTLDSGESAGFGLLLADFLAGFPAEPSAPAPAGWGRSEIAQNEGFAVPSPVNYVGKGANLYEQGYRLHGSALAVNGYLNRTWLYDRIRAQGGAYGAGSRFDYLSGNFAYTSYRDPNLLSTLDNYDAAPAFLRRLDLSEGELTKAVVAAIGRLDSYRLPPDKGFTSLTRFLTGETDEWRQRMREEVLSTGPEDFAAFAGALEAVREAGHIVAMGSEEALQAAGEQRPGLWSTITRAL